MTIATREIFIENLPLILTNQRVAFLPSQKALLLSDLHIGKTAHFRKHGIALPKDIFRKDLQRLETVLKYFQAEKIFIVGDLLHAGNNSDVEDFCRWKSSFQSVEFHLVTGNHDKVSADLEEQLCLTSHKKIIKLENFQLIHEFSEDSEKFQIIGHIHPGILVRNRVKRLRLPCFVKTDRQLLLPAFSEFTGLDTKNTPKNGVFYAFTKDKFFEF